MGRTFQVSYFFSWVCRKSLRNSLKSLKYQTIFTTSTTMPLRIFWNGLYRRRSRCRALAKRRIGYHYFRRGLRQRGFRIADVRYDCSQPLQKNSASYWMRQNYYQTNGVARWKRRRSKWRPFNRTLSAWISRVWCNPSRI